MAVAGEHLSFSRCVRRETFPDATGGGAAKLSHFSVLVDGPAIQQHDHLSAQMPQQLRKVLHQLDGRHVPGINLEIQSQALAHRRHGQPSDDRQAIPPVAVPQDGSPAPGCPGALHRRNKQKPALIQEDQMRRQGAGFFLYAAIGSVSTAGFFSRCAAGPAVRASGNSSPTPPTPSIRAPDDSRCPNGGGFARPRAGRSTFRWSNRPRALRPSAARSALAAGEVSFPADDRAWGEASSQPCPCAGRIASTGPANLRRTEPCGPQLDTSGRVLKAQPPWCAAPVIVQQCLRVSRTPLCRSSENISIIYAELNNCRSIPNPFYGSERNPMADARWMKHHPHL